MDGALGTREVGVGAAVQSRLPHDTSAGDFARSAYGIHL